MYITVNDHWFTGWVRNKFVPCFIFITIMHHAIWYWCLSVAIASYSKNAWFLRSFYGGANLRYCPTKWHGIMKRLFFQGPCFPNEVFFQAKHSKRNIPKEMVDFLITIRLIYPYLLSSVMHDEKLNCLDLSHSISEKNNFVLNHW